MSVIRTGKATQGICCDKDCDVCRILVEAPSQAATSALVYNVPQDATHTARISAEQGWFGGLITGVLAGMKGRITDIHLCSSHAEMMKVCLGACGIDAQIRPGAHRVKH